jgi:hypothetical protein
LLLCQVDQDLSCGMFDIEQAEDSCAVICDRDILP